MPENTERKIAILGIRHSTAGATSLLSGLRPHLGFFRNRFPISPGAPITCLLFLMLFSAFQANAQSEKINQAIRQGDTIMLEALLKADPRAVNNRNREGESPLHWAALSGHANVVSILIENGADINARTKDKWTPLHWAALKGHIRIIEILLDNGADINAKTDGGWTALHVAAYQNEKNSIAKLIERGADVNAKDADGRTPLETIAEKSRSTILQLVENGASLEPVTAKPWSPFRWASKEQANREELAELNKKTRELETKIAQTDQLREQLRKELEQTRDERSNFDQIAKDRVERIRAAKDTEIEGLQNQISELQTELSGASETIKEAQTTLKSRRKDESLLEQLNEKLRTESAKSLDLERTMAEDRRKAQETIDQLNSRIRIIEQNINDSELAQRRLRDQLEEQTSKNSELLASIKTAAETEINLKQQTISALKDKWIDDQAGITKLQERIKNIEAERVILMNRLEAEKRERTKLETASADSAAESEKRMQALREELKAAEQTGLSFKEEIEKLKAVQDENIRAITQKVETDIKSRDAEILSLKERWAGDQQVIAQLNDDLQNALNKKEKINSLLKTESEKLSDAEKAVAQQAETAKQHQTKTAALQDDLDKLRKEYTLQKQTAEKNELTLVEKDKTIDSLTSANEKMTEQLTQLSQALTRQEYYHADIQEELRDSLDKLSKAKREAEAKLKDAETAEIRLRKQLEQQEGELNVLITTLKARQVQDGIEIATLTEKLKNASAEKQQIKSQHNETSEKLAAALTAAEKNQAYAQQLENALTDAHMQTLELKNALTETQAERNKAQLQTAETQAQLEKQTAELARQLAAKQDLAARLADTLKSVESAKRETDNLEKERDTLISTNKALTKTLTEKAEQLDNTNNNLEQLQKEKAEVEQTLSNRVAQAGREISDLAAKLDSARKTINAQNETGNKLQVQTEMLQSKLAQLEAALNQSERDTSAMKNALAEMQTERNKAQLQTAETQAQLEKQTAELAGQLAAKQDLAARLADTLKNMESAKRKTDNLEKERDTLISTNKALTKTLTKKAEQLDNTNNNLEQLQKEKAEVEQTLSNRVAQADTEISDLAAKLDSAGKIIKAQDETGSKLQAQTETLQSKLAQLETALEQSERDTSAMKKALTETQAERNKAQQQTAETQAKLETQNAQLTQKLNALEKVVQAQRETEKELTENLLAEALAARTAEEQAKKLQLSVTQLEAALAKSELRTAELNDVATKLDAENKKLEQLTNEKNEVEQSLSNKIALANKQISALAVNLDSAEKTILNERAQFKAENEKLQRRFADSESGKALTEQTALNEKLSQQVAYLTKLNKELTERVSADAEVTAELNAAKKAIKESADMEIATLNAKVNSLEQTLKETAETRAGLLGSLEESQSTIENRNRTITSLETRLAELEKMQSEFEKTRNLNQELTRQAVSEAAAKKDVLQETENRVQQALEETKKLREQLNQTRARELALNEQIRNDREKQETLRRNLETAARDTESNKNEIITALQSDLEKQQATITELKRETDAMDQLKAELANARETNKKLSSSILEEATTRVESQQQAEEMTGALAARIQELEKTLQENEISRLDILKNLKERQETIEALRADMRERIESLDTERKEEISGLQSTLSAAIAKAAGLESQLKTAEALQAELNREKTANKQLSTELSAAAREKLQLQEELDARRKTAQTEASELSRKISALEQQINEIDFARMQALHELKAQQDENRALKDRLVRRLADPASSPTTIDTLPEHGLSALTELTKVKVVRNGVNLRASPQSDAQVVCQVAAETILAARNIGETWAEVIPPTHIALWIHSDFVSGNAVNADQVHVRAGPGIGHEIVGQLVKGDEIHMQEKSGVWIKFLLPRMKSLWVKREMITPAP